MAVITASDLAGMVWRKFCRNFGGVYDLSKNDWIMRLFSHPIDTVIRQSLWTALQPIVDLHAFRVVAHEVFLRGPHATPWAFPQALFSAADQQGRRIFLEAQARQLAVQRLGDLPSTHHLFVNVDPAYPDLAVEIAQPASARLVLEISEEHPILDNPMLAQHILQWREAGYPVALDHFEGRLGLSALVRLHPDLLKLDRTLVAGSQHDLGRRVLLEHLIALCHDLDILVIATGIEQLSELAILQELGVRYGQGFLFGKPARHPQNNVRSFRL